MDESLLSRTGIVEEEPKSLPLRREFRSSYLDLGPSLRQSTTRVITNEAIIPIITTPNSSSYVNLIADLSKRKKLTRRSHSAPSVFTDAKDAFDDPIGSRPGQRPTPTIVRQAFIGAALYVIAGIVVFVVTCGSFKGDSTYPLVDALYFIVVTLCTIGYGDIVPDSTFTKLFTSFFILIGFGIIGILLNGLVTYICDRQEAVMLSTVDENRFNTMVRTYMIDKEKGRMRIRIKVCLASAVVIGCIAVLAISAHFLEELSWVDSFYLSVTSVTTVGYGDYSFTTMEGRCFATVWLLVSTFAVARAFLYLTELRIYKRSRRITKWVLQRKITLGDLIAADLDNDGSISKSEFVVHKLKEMGKIAEKDILQICNQFDSFEHGNSGKITLADLMDDG